MADKIRHSCYINMFKLLYIFILFSMELIIDNLATNNSYVSLEEAESYFEGRIHSREWSSASEENKKKALITATSILDSLQFIGRKYKEGNPGSEDYQALQWPRYPAYDDPYLLGIPHLFSYTKETREWVNAAGVPIIPKALKDATCEEAYFLICAGRGLDKREHIKAQGLNSVSYPNISESYAVSTAICPAAMRHLAKIACVESCVRVVRG